MSTANVRAEWCARVAAEYTSAAITQNLVLWLIQAGAPPDLIEAGLVIVSDELTHSRMSHEVYQAAGGTAAAALDPGQLGLERKSANLGYDILHVAVRVFCLGETVAVPLFRHLRGRATVSSARAALDRILHDEVRHRDFGWDLLDWLCVSPIADEVVGRLEAELPAMFSELQECYGQPSGETSGEDHVITDEERTWGLAPAREYASILARTFDREYLPRFAARGIDAAFARPPGLTCP